MPVFFAANTLLSVSRCRILAELAMMLWFVVGALFPALLLAAPPPINKLALFPDKSAWCEAKNITQIVGHSGCESKSIQNRYRGSLSPGTEAAGGTGVTLGTVARTRSQAVSCLCLSQGKVKPPLPLLERAAPPLSPHPSCCLCRACLGQCFSYSVPNTFPQSTESLVHCDSCMPAQSMWEIVSILLCSVGPQLCCDSTLRPVLLLPWGFPTHFIPGCLSGDCTVSQGAWVEGAAGSSAE